MTWGVKENVIERFGEAGIKHENINCTEDSFTFIAACSPKEYVGMFKIFYGPTMNAFEAAEKNGKTAELESELITLFEKQNTAALSNTIIIPATFLKVTVNC